MRINPSLLENVELVLPLKTDREIFTTEHVSVVIQIGDHFGASLLDHRVHWSGPNRPPTIRMIRGEWSEDKKSFKGLLTKPSEFRSWCTAEGEFIFRLICMHLNEIGLQSWMFLDNLPLGEWVTGELEWLEKDSRNFSDDVVIEIDKNKVLEEVKNVQSMCVDHFFDIDGYFEKSATSDHMFALSDLECSPIQSELQDLFPLRLFEFVADINKQKEGRALVVTDLIDSFNLECINSDLDATYEVKESGSLSVSIYLNWGTIHGVSEDGVVSLEDVSFVLHGDKEDVTFHERNAIGWILLSLFTARIAEGELTVIGNYDFSERLDLAELQSRFFGQEAASDWCNGMDISYIALKEGRKKWGLEFFSYDNCHFGLAVSHLSWGNYIWFNGT